MLTTKEMPTSLENDLLFKEILTHPKNRDKLIYFLTCFTNFTEDYLNKQDLKVYYEHTFLKTKLQDKALRGDILIEFNDIKINIECYSNFFDTASFDKSLMYVMRIYATSLERGENYKSSYQVLGINLIDNLENDTIIKQKLQSNANVIYDETIALNDVFKIDFYRLDLAKKFSYNEANKQVIWLKFIGAKDYDERKKIAKGDKKLTELNESIKEYINDEKTRILFGEWAEYIALKKGERKGERKSLLKTIQNMLNNNFTLEDISKATDLSIGEIEKLRKEKP